MLIIPSCYLRSFSVCVNRANDKDRTLMFTVDLMKRAIKGPGTKIRRVPGPTKPLLSMQINMGIIRYFSRFYVLFVQVILIFVLLRQEKANCACANKILRSQMHYIQYFPYHSVWDKTVVRLKVWEIFLWDSHSVPVRFLYDLWFPNLRRFYAFS